MSPLNQLIREPLAHFVVAGALLFGAYSLTRDDSAATSDSNTIVVDRRELLTFLQYRANAFEAETFGAALDAMSDAELQAVIDAYVDEEALYREAQAYGLEQSDNVIRQRMVQKMSFLMSDLAAGGLQGTPEELQAYFNENLEAYAIQPWATFTHVFFDATRHGAEGARTAAEAAKQQLNDSGALFNDATGVGDNFPFLRNYVERTFEYIASHFGYDFAGSLQTIDASATLWQGPFRSAYGEHIVLMTERAERRYPELEEVLSDVEFDFENQQSMDALDEMTQAIRDTYRVEIGAIRSGDPE